MRTRAVLCAAAALAALTLLPPAAGAAWTAPAFLSGAGLQASSPHVAMDDDGDALSAWAVNKDGVWRVQVRPRTAAGAWGGVTTISPSGLSSAAPRVALDADGDAVIVWSATGPLQTVVQARTRSATGVLGPVVTLSGGNAFSPRVAVDDDGDAIVTWHRFLDSLRVQARTRSAAGTWSSTRTLSAEGLDGFIPDVAMNDTGGGLVVWHRSGSPRRIQSAAFSTTGGWGSALPVSPLGVDAIEPKVAMEADGDALVVWNDFGAMRVQARRRTAAGTFGVTETLSTVQSAQAQVAMSPDGTATAVWQDQSATLYAIGGRTRTPGNVWGAVRDLSDSPGGAGTPRVAAGAGATTAVWRQLDPDDTSRTWSRQWLAGSLRPATRLSPGGQSAADAEVAMEEAGGEAIAIWTRSDGSDTRVEMSSGS